MPKVEFFSVGRSSGSWQEAGGSGSSSSSWQEAGGSGSGSFSLLLGLSGWADVASWFSETSKTSETVPATATATASIPDLSRAKLSPKNQRGGRVYIRVISVGEQV